MNQSTPYHLIREVPTDADDEIRQRTLMSSRREAGNQLLAILMKHRLPAVVDFREEIFQYPNHDHPFLGRPVDIIQIDLEVTPVMTKEVTIYKPTDDLAHLPTEPSLRKLVEMTAAKAWKMLRGRK